RLHVALRGFTYVHHADYLALTRCCGYQEDRPLTISIPIGKYQPSLHCQSRYFIQAPRFIW
ncbi:hypothetical protein, partial [Vibrio splendidus]|uniref:hypothetical protein n=1 Tax=Vibrio splendidus TaxID=29497 RepID=UPI001A7E1A68